MINTIEVAPAILAWSLTKHLMENKDKCFEVGHIWDGRDYVYIHENKLRELIKEFLDKK